MISIKKLDTIAKLPADYRGKIPQKRLSAVRRSGPRQLSRLQFCRYGRHAAARRSNRPFRRDAAGLHDQGHDFTLKRQALKGAPGGGVHRKTERDPKNQEILDGGYFRTLVKLDGVPHLDYGQYLRRPGQTDRERSGILLARRHLLDRSTFRRPRSLASKASARTTPATGSATHWERPHTSMPRALRFCGYCLSSPGH